MCRLKNNPKTIGIQLRAPIVRKQLIEVIIEEKVSIMYTELGAYTITQIIQVKIVAVAFLFSVIIDLIYLFCKTIHPVSAV